MNNIVDRNNKVVNTSIPYVPDIRYPMHDLMSVGVHYDASLGRNVPTPNKLKGDANDGKNSK